MARHTGKGNRGRKSGQTNQGSVRSGSGSRAKSTRGSRSEARGSSGSTQSSSRRSRTLTDHEEIQNWVEDRGGRPACVMGTGGEGDTGMIRLEFPGSPGSRDENLEEIEWDEWFEKFDDDNLALVAEETNARGQKSNFNKIVSRENAGGERLAPGPRITAAS